jgi:hypothetical protein
MRSVMVSWNVAHVPQPSAIQTRGSPLAMPGESLSPDASSRSGRSRPAELQNS